MHLLVLSSHRNSLLHGQGLFNTDVKHSLILPKNCTCCPNYVLMTLTIKNEFFLNINLLSIMETAALHNEDNRIHRLPSIIETLTVHNGDWSRSSCFKGLKNIFMWRLRELMKLSLKTAKHMAQIRTVNSHINSSITTTYGARIEFMTFNSQSWT